MTKRIFTFILIILINIAVTSAWCATYYVAQTPAGLEDGSSYNNRMGLAAHNLGNFSPNDIIYLCDIITSAVVLPSSGTKEYPIVYKGNYPGHPAVIEVPHFGPTSGFRSLQNHITVMDLTIQNIYGQGMSFTRANGNYGITIERVTISETTRGNGILVAYGGSDFRIVNCTVSNAQNSCIAIMGSSSNPTSNTLIENCTISGAVTNDGITLHKDGELNDLGSGHVIKNNVISDCYEQGIDITAGTSIMLENNRTYGNKNAGVIVGHGVSDVKIVGHDSKNEGAFGIVITDSTNVELTGSLIMNSGTNAELQVNSCSGFTASNNTIVSDVLSPLIDIAGASRDIVFENNRIYVTTQSGNGVMLRYLTTTPTEVNSSWKNNVWSNPANNQRVFYNPNEGIFFFDKWQSDYAASDKFEPYVQLEKPKNLTISACPKSIFF